jgi:hypothetical protein
MPRPKEKRKMILKKAKLKVDEAHLNNHVFLHISSSAPPPLFLKEMPKEKIWIDVADITGVIADLLQQEDSLLAKCNSKSELAVLLS